MAKVKINNRAIQRRVQEKVKEIKGALGEERFLREVGDRAVKDIQRETRLGNGFKDSQFKRRTDNDRARLPALKNSSIATRRYVAQYNRTAQAYKPGRSNLSLTGQLVESVSYFIRRGKLFIGASGNRKPYKTKNGRQRSAPTNSDLVDFLDKKGFHFIGVDDKTIERIKKIAIRNIRRLLRS